MSGFEKVVIITRKTLLEELITRFNTKSQAKFYITAMGGSFEEYEKASIEYKTSLEKLKTIIPSTIKQQYVDRDFLPNFLFSDKDLVITLGPDGLVVNTAKYLTIQPILAINPDPSRIDGVLIPFTINNVKKHIERILDEDISYQIVNMAKAKLNDGQELYGFNDLFIGQKTHVSARYVLKYRGREEFQSSSGIIVSTGAGSTGWLKSIITGSYKISKTYGGEIDTNYHRKRFSKNKKEAKSIPDTQYSWSANYLYFSVREPFPSKITGVENVFGTINEDEKLIITSRMPENGVIFSDGVEKDFLAFNSGSIAEIMLADKSAKIISE